MPRIEAVLRLVLDDDYTIVADAIETARVSPIFFLKSRFKAFTSIKTRKR